MMPPGWIAAHFSFMAFTASEVLNTSSKGFSEGSSYIASGTTRPKTGDMDYIIFVKPRDFR